MQSRSYVGLCSCEGIPIIRRDGGINSEYPCIGIDEILVGNGWSLYFVQDLFRDALAALDILRLVIIWVDDGIGCHPNLLLEWLQMSAVGCYVVEDAFGRRRVDVGRVGILKRDFLFSMIIIKNFIFGAGWLRVEVWRDVLLIQASWLLGNCS